MPRSHSALSSESGDTSHTDAIHGRALTGVQCAYGLECVEQNRRSGTWVGSFVCPNCRSEYFYAYRWGRLLKKS